MKQTELKLQWSVAHLYNITISELTARPKNLKQNKIEQNEKPKQKPTNKTIMGIQQKFYFYRRTTKNEEDGFQRRRPNHKCKHRFQPHLFCRKLKSPILFIPENDKTKKKTMSFSFIQS